MYTKILAQGTKFGSGTTGLDNSDVHSLFIIIKPLAAGMKQLILVQYYKKCPSLNRAQLTRNFILSHERSYGIKTNLKKLYDNVQLLKAKFIEIN